MILILMINGGIKQWTKENLRLNTISTEDDGYYYLYNEHGELACMDGEEVNITEIGDIYISFINNNGEYSVYFALTRKEAEIGIIGGFKHEKNNN